MVSSATERIFAGPSAAYIETAHDGALQAIDRLAGAWDSLPATNPMGQAIWAKSCAEAFGIGRRLDVVTVGPADRPRAVIPLFVPSEGPARLEVLGSSMLGEPADLVSADPQALADLCRALAGRKLPVFLGRVPADSPTIAALQRAYRGRGAVFTRPAKPYPTIPLDASWQDPDQHLTPRRRSDLRRARRRAEALGPLAVETHAPSPSELAPLLEEAFRVEEKSWKGRAQTAMAKDQVRGDFFRRYTDAAARQGILRLCFLRINGRAAAMQIAIEHANRYWLLKIGYDEELGRCSPGMLLLSESVRRAAERGLEGYEFLGNVAPWTRVWTQIERNCVAIRAYPASVHGLSQLAADGARYAARKLWSLSQRAAPAEAAPADDEAGSESMSESSASTDKKADGHS